MPEYGQSAIGCLILLDAAPAVPASRNLGYLKKRLVSDTGHPSPGVDNQNLVDSVGAFDMQGLGLPLHLEAQLHPQLAPGACHGLRCRGKHQFP